jgi:hypothetical protein
VPSLVTSASTEIIVRSPIFASMSALLIASFGITTCSCENPDEIASVVVYVVYQGFCVPATIAAGIVVALCSTFAVNL